MIKYLLATLTFLMVGCAHFPPKPEIKLCSIFVGSSLMESVLICYPLEAKEDVPAVEIPLEQAQGYLALSPDDWQKADHYIKELKKELVRCAGGSQ